MNVGLDVGYSATKAVSDGRRASFPSIVGTMDRARFALSSNGVIALKTPGPYLVGQEAVRQSRFAARQESRDWIESPQWYALAMAALSELTTAKGADLVVVTGLPVAFYADKDRLQQVLKGEHKVQREGSHAQLLRVREARVIPQPFGALLATCLDDRGRVTSQNLATGRVGVIDVGGKTTNLLSVSRLAEVGRETSSVGRGAWDVMRAVRAHLEASYPGLEEKRDHELMHDIVSRQTRYYGEPVDLGEAIDEVLEPMAADVLATAGQLWNGGATLDAILVAGGGAHLLGPYIKETFRHAYVVDDPVFANASGFWKLAQRVG